METPNKKSVPLNIIYEFNNLKNQNICNLDIVSSSWLKMNSVKAITSDVRLTSIYILFNENIQIFHLFR